MAYKLKELRYMSIEELVRKHDEIAPGTVLTPGYFLDEIARREQDEHTRTIKKFTKWIAIMTFIVMLFTFLNMIF